MSRAFVKEDDGRAGEELPDRAIPLGRNLVTAEGLAAIDAQIERLRREYAAAKAGGDHAASASAARDLRYWTARRASAELVAPPEDTTQVQFGSRVTIRRQGRRQTFRIVGEDEADPKRGTLSHASPLARALFGANIGDIVRVGTGEAEVVEIG